MLSSSISISTFSLPSEIWNDDSALRHLLGESNLRILNGDLDGDLDVRGDGAWNTFMLCGGDFDKFGDGDLRDFGGIGGPTNFWGVADGEFNA